MEVFGVIAGIPSVITIIQTTISIVKQFSQKKVLFHNIDGLQHQLDSVKSILDDLRRRKPTSFDQSSLRGITAHVAELEKHLTGLNTVLNRQHVAKGSLRRLAGQLKLAVTGFDKTIKEYRDGIEETKTSLILLLQNGTQNEISSMGTTQLRLQLESNLSSCDDDFIPRKLDSTCEWIWYQNDLKKWAEHTQGDEPDPFRRLFCLHGPTGCGKSVLSASVATKLRERGKIVASFSFRAPYSTHQTFRSLLETVLSQLLPHVSDADLDQLPRHFIGSSSLSGPRLKEALSSVFRLVKSDVYLMIDGVDEATDTWDDSKTSNLSTIIDFLEHHPNTRVWLSGRESALRAAIRKHPAEIQIREELIRGDMEKFIEEQLDQSKCARVSLMRDVIRESLKENCQMMFLWVILFFKGLKQDATESEVTDSLNIRLGNLDAKYCGLLNQSMNRTGGTSADPSVSMKRAKRLFSLIIAASQPLTLTELDCAYATEYGGTQSPGYSKLTRDGIIDDCAGLVVETGGEFHLIHASAAEFLTRPVNKWGGINGGVVHFRIDQTSAQKMIFQACAKYLISLDLGYPMYDENEGDERLPAKYPFFTYASKSVPTHLLDVMHTPFDPESRTVLQNFISSTQFCSLIEFVVRTIEMDSWDTVAHWTGLLVALTERETCPDGEAPKASGDLYSNIMTSFEQELNRRATLFGQDDRRCQKWASIIGFAADFYGLDAKVVKTNQETQFGESSITVPMPNLDSATKGALSALPAFLAKTEHKRNMLISVQSGRFALSQFRSLRSLLVLRLDILPVPIHIFWAWTHWRTKHENRPAAKCAMERALCRVAGKRDYYEGWCLLLLAVMENCDDPKAHSVDSCLALSLLQESLVVADGLNSHPHTEMLILYILSYLSRILLSHEMWDDGLKISRRLEISLCNNEFAQKGPAWCKIIYQGEMWSRQALSLLRYHSIALRNAKRFDDSERIIQFVLDSYSKRNRCDHPKMFRATETKAATLWLAGNVEEAYTIMRSSLKRLDDIKRSKEHDSIRFTHLWQLAWCLMERDMREEVAILLSDVETASVMDDFNNAQNMLELLARAGCVDRAMSLYRCWNEKNKANSLSTLDWMASWGLNEIVEAMLDAGTSIESQDEINGYTALSFASVHGNTSLVQLLVERGASTHHVDRDGHTAMELALMQGHVDVVKVFVERGASIPFQHPEIWFIKGAVDSGYAPMVQYLVDQGANVCERGRHQETLLMRASAFGRVDIVKILLGAGAEISRRDDRYVTALQYAIRHRHDSCTQLLRHREASLKRQTSKRCKRHRIYKIPGWHKRWVPNRRYR
ncbi:hypothetical protein PFICI_02840 [Pestalotiopsis fici W106-1]|uniref:Nephrocystin 3-like N-terminal domain-containing protein n=1 Tax=Pestalotiopsis fici (strain W106-1 / CGMCC3.15140) TaxID=1229662 RepID=W3XFK9_PESFW|nr:uncharacterized protein PFICI_02840 [Pestalotiopsis fici W106-1]ETS84815.1 hypothetical protein PFICI_02840 [Pestalotiopsis fici W106-1]